MEMGFDLQAMNDDTANKIQENRVNIDKSRERLLQDTAGVAPRMLHFDLNTRQARHNVDNALRLVRNLKEFKKETFNRLSQPWTFSKYS
ncbi:unnamed protein product [Rotaria magnacalcarata]